MEIKISRKTALDLMRPIQMGKKKTSLMEILDLQWVMSREYDGSEYGYDDKGKKLWSGVNSDDYDTIAGDSTYKNFQIWI